LKIKNTPKRVAKQCNVFLHISLSRFIKSGLNAVFSQRSD